MERCQGVAPSRADQVNCLRIHVEKKEMAETRWEQIKEIFDAALRQEEPERLKFLAEACSGDDELRKEVESLLASFVDAESFLEDPAVPPTQSELNPGQTLGDYEIVRPLGAGGMGEVYLAVDKKLNRRVAIKRLPPDLSTNSDANERLLREARAAATLDHPNICPIHQVAEADGSGFIVMQYIEGETLAERLTRAPVSVVEALDLAIQIADALSEAHGARIIHRDIKPSNIIINKRGSAKVLDFGLAKFIETRSEDETAKLLSTSGAILGTVPYMSPEQVRGKKLDARTDIFSFGALLYEMLSGRPPFARDSTAEVISAILNDDPPTESIPHELLSVVEYSLAKDREKRYQSIDDMLVDLKDQMARFRVTDTTDSLDRSMSGYELPGNRPASIQQPNSTSSAEYIVTQIQRNKSKVIVGLIALLCFAGVLGYGGFRYSQSFRETVQPDNRSLAQFTFGTGLQSEPVWSPDGRFIAYSGDAGGNFDIWIQQVSDGKPNQITRDASHDWQPDWSPDGNNLVFRSERDGGGIFVTPAFGGNERRLTNFGYQPHWSPDGTRILFYNSNIQNVTAPPKVFIVDVKGGTPREILADLTREFPGRLRVAWHPDGQRISLWGSHRKHGLSFWTVPITGGDPFRSEFSEETSKQIRDVDVDLFDFFWAADARSIYFEGTAKGVRNLWKVVADPKTLEWVRGPERLTTGAGIDSDIALSKDGSSLAFTTRVERTRLWSFGFQAGKIAADGQSLTPPGLNVLGSDLSRDDKKLAYIVQRGEKREIWQKGIPDGEDKLLLSAEDYIPTAPRWSRDGRRLAFARNNFSESTRGQQYTFRLEHAISVLGHENNGEQILTTPHVQQGWAWDWTPDDKYLLGSSARQTSGTWGLFLFPTDSAPEAEAAAQLVNVHPDYDAFNARFSPDNRWISFIAINHTDLGDAAIYVAPAAGGEWVRVTEGRSYDDKPRWSGDGKTLYFLSNRSGFFNVWGIKFDAAAGRPAGGPFRVTNLENPGRMIPPIVTEIEMSVSSERLVIPIMEVSGNVWILKDAIPQ